MTIYKKLVVVGCVALGMSVASVQTGCYYDREEELYGAGNICSDTTTVKYATTVSALMTANCTGCHGGASPSAGIKIDDYTTLKAYVTTSKAAFLGCMYQTGGYSAMPKGGSKMAYCDVNKIERWINAGMPNN